MNQTSRPSDPSRPSLERIGRYRILSRLGKGAMGVVYAAHDELIDREVAVKVLMADVESEPEIRTRFMREAQVAAKLSHPNIVTILDVGEEHGRLYIVMERLRGLTLANRLKERRLSLEESLDVMVQVCEGLSVAAGAAVCHRDIKPGNLFLQEDGCVKILDFGIARLASSTMTASGFIVGTPDFMSPEQARGIDVDERSDIFSVGAVWYLLLTGNKPFAAPDLPAVLHKVVSEEPPPLAGTETPHALVRIVERAMVKDPGQRYQTFGEFTSDASRFRRRYVAETRVFAGRTLTQADEVLRLFDEVARRHLDLKLPAPDDRDQWFAEVRLVHPEIEAKGLDALRSGTLERGVIQEVGARLETWRRKADASLLRLQNAEQTMADAAAAVDNGDALSALPQLEAAYQEVPSPVIAERLQACRTLVEEQQRLRVRVQSLLEEADAFEKSGDLESALVAVEAAHATLPSPHTVQLTRRLRDTLDQREAEWRHDAELRVAAIRRAIDQGALDEAERQLVDAQSSGHDLPQIGLLSEQIAAARTAQSQAEAAWLAIDQAMEKARAAAGSGHIGEAIETLSALLRAQPSAPGVQSELTRLAEQQKRRAAAEQRRLDAEEAATRGDAEWTRGNLETALTFAQSALALAADNEHAILLAAKAKAALREAAERQALTKQAEELIGRAIQLAEQGRFDKAIADARQALDLNPSDTGAARLIAQIVARQADTEQRRVAAAEAQQRLETARVKSADAKKALQAGAVSRARQLALEAISLNPQLAEARRLLLDVSALQAIASSRDDDTVGQTVPVAAQPPPTGAAAPSIGQMFRRATLGASGLASSWLGRGKPETPAKNQPGGPGRPQADVK